MRALRQFFRDRSSAAALVAVIVQLMLLQTVAAGQACLDVAFGGGPQVLCSGAPVPAGWAGFAGETSGDGSGHCPDCPCATLCSSSAPHAVLAPPIVEPAVFADRPVLTSRALYKDTHLSRALPPGELRLRGPPASSA
ncbi:hypothetical protein [Jiella pacifica]|uniref:DUF2946 domain-containing protein n=1 Tax=Jiella pacifica TaxID=2696469 RepID=A0A6N9SZ27_9HYPH|nr:hypothetical protein [Jiella pacifica]NDW04353.1 hypothetical protein [Jiella pacifica]